MHIAIIGAGIAGLLSLHHAIKNNIQCTVFEQSKDVGGVWLYTDKVGTNEFGLPVHTSLYEGLRSNLPSQLMSIPDYPNNITSYNFTSYLKHEDVLKYINEFADHFDLRKHIKKLCPNCVIIATGPRHEPNYPHLKGIETFNGKKLHSHDFRNPRPFKNQRVLLIGAGFSGLDLTYHLSKVAQKVFLSNHLADDISKFYPNNVILKPDVDHVDKSNIHFKDGTTEEVDSILYCTGYKLTFPFLTPEAGLTYENEYVKPLYKQIINIEHPTMAIIGLPFHTIIFNLLDLQTRFYIEYLKNPSKFPRKHQMYMEKQKDEELLRKIGRKMHKFHQLAELNDAYFTSLSKIAQIKNIRPVDFKIFEDRLNRAKSELAHYRGDLYNIIDDENFTVVRSKIEFY